MAQTNPVLAVIHQTDQLTLHFRQVHDATAPTIGQLRMVGMTKGDDQAREDSLLFVLRQALEALEQDVEGMFALVYQIQAFALAADPGDASSASANLTSLRPQIQRAQDHVSQAVDAYQAELLSKRELLYEFVAETYDTQEFCDRWSRLDELSTGAKLDVDALTDLLGGLGGI